MVDKITVTVDMIDGSNVPLMVDRGTRVSGLGLPKDVVIILNGIEERSDVELRDGDEITVSKRSQKVAA